MELVKLVVVCVLLLINVFCQEMDVDNWKEDIEENKCPNSEDIRAILSRRNPGTRQYLLGKKNSGIGIRMDVYLLLSSLICFPLLKQKKHRKHVNDINSKPLWV